MNDQQNSQQKSWHPGGGIGVGHDMEGNIIVTLYGAEDAIVRLNSVQANELGNCIKRLARTLSRRATRQGKKD